MECNCEANTTNTTNDINAYAGGIVRKGEYWTVASKRPGKTGFECVFTPRSSEKVRWLGKAGAVGSGAGPLPTALAIVR